MKGIHPQPCCDVVGESLAQVVPKLSYFHLWSCLEIQSSQADKESSEELGSHSGILGWPPGIILLCGTSCSSTGLPGRSVCALWFWLLTQWSQRFLHAPSVLRARFVSDDCSCKFLLQCYTAMLWSKTKPCLCTGLQWLSLSLMKSCFIRTGLTHWPK